MIWRPTLYYIDFNSKGLYWCYTLFSSHSMKSTNILRIIQVLQIKYYYIQDILGTQEDHASIFSHMRKNGVLNVDILAINLVKIVFFLSHSPVKNISDA